MKNLVRISFLFAFSMLYGCISQTDSITPIFKVSGILDEEISYKHVNYSRIIKVEEFEFAIGINDYTIYKLDHNQQVVSNFGGDGFGPGEFKDITTLNYDGTYLYVYDRTLKKVAVLSLDLDLVEEFIIEESIFSINFSQPERAFAIEFSMDRWSLLGYDKSTFRNPTYLYTTSTRRADAGIGLIYSSEEYLLINHLFTNTSTTYRFDTGTVSTSRFNYLSDRPEMIKAGQLDAPRAPVWFGAILRTDNIYQLATYNGAINFIATDLSGNLLYRVILNNEIDIARFFDQGVVGLKNDVVYYYSLESLIQDDILTKR